MAIISEPNKNLAKRNSWYTDINSDAAICLTGSKKTSIQGWGQETGFVWIEFMEMILI